MFFTIVEREGSRRVDFYKLDVSSLPDMKTEHVIYHNKTRSGEEDYKFERVMYVNWFIISRDDSIEVSDEGL